MASLKLVHASSPTDFRPGRWLESGALVHWTGQGRGFDILVKELGSQRELRDAMLSLAYSVGRSHEATGLLVVLGDSMTTQRFEFEVAMFEAITRPELWTKLSFVHAVKTSTSFRVKAMVGKAPQEALDWLRDCQLRPTSVKPKPRPRVLAVMTHCSLTQHPPLTLAQISQLSGVSYPAVKEALNHLAAKRYLLGEGARGSMLRNLEPREWIELAQQRNDQDQVVYFRDPTGFLTPRALLQRVGLPAKREDAPAVRVGGFFGALAHDPQVNLTGAPRLDVHSGWPPDALADHLDAGLERCERRHPQCVLAVHASANELAKLSPCTGDSAQMGGWPPATALECLADLWELGYQAQAQELAVLLSQRQLHISQCCT